MARKLTTKEFIERSKLLHGDKYDYSLSEYKTNKTPIKIICSTHGVFETLPSIHLQGFQCPNCKYGGSGLSERTANFIKKAQEQHKDRNYDYSLVEYNVGTDKVKIICPIHGQFVQQAKNHLHGQKCPDCAKIEGAEKQQINSEDFIKKAKEIVKHDIKIDEKSVVKTSQKVKFYCEFHGWQQEYMSKILRGLPCKVCNLEQMKLKQSEFIMVANNLHDFKYIYPEYTLVNTKAKIKIICPIHGEFIQKINSHLNGNGCPKCAFTTSRFELNILELIKKHSGIIPKKHRLSNNKHIDILYQNVGFECNGLFYHCETPVKGSRIIDKNYHLLKTDVAAKEGIKLYHIFEDEYLHKKDIVYHKVLNACKIDYGFLKIGARQCEIKTIDFQTCKKFLEKYHIQGSDKSAIRYGAYFKNELVGVITFKSKENGMDFELNRFATSFEYKIVGLCSKMIKRFVKDFDPHNIISFADIRWTPDKNDNIYIKSGFELVEQLPPTYHYVHNKQKIKRFNRMKFQKHKILKNFKNIDGVSEDKTERELMILLGYQRIWDCGNWKFLLKVK